MRQRLHSSAISIQRYAYGETSQLVHFLTEEHGRVAVLVRGAFRAKNSYHGPIDLLVRGDVEIRTVSGRELGLLLSRRIETAYPALRRELPRFLAAHHVLQILCDAVPVGAGTPETFRLLDRALVAAETLATDRLPLLLLSFDLQTLRHLGLEPALEACVRCDRERPPGAAFVAAEGGLVCRTCDPRAEGPRPGRDVLDLLAVLRSRRVADVPLPTERTLAAARRLVRDHVSYQLECAPPERRLAARLPWR